MNKISNLIRLDKEYLAFCDALSSAFSAKTPLPIVVNGLFGGAMNVFLSEAVRDAKERCKAPCLVLLPTEAERRKTYEALTSLGVSCLEYKERDFVFHNISASHDTERERLSVLHSVLMGEASAVLTTPKALLSYTMPIETLTKCTTKIKLGDEIEIRGLCEKISKMGYTRVDIVESFGQFARRGDILDIWLGGEEYPTRIEFFGDEIDRLSHFDAITQRSIDTVNELLVLPASEVIFDKDAKDRVLSEIDHLISKCEAGEACDTLKRERATVENALSLNSRDKYIYLCYASHQTLLSYLFKSGRASVFISDVNGVKEALKRHTDATQSAKSALVLKNLISEKNARYSIKNDEYEQLLNSSVTVYLHPFAGGVDFIKSLGGLFGFSTRKTVAYGENPSMLKEDLISYRKSGYKTLLLCENTASVKSLGK